MEGNAGAAVEFQNPPRHVVEEVAVVRHRDDRALVLLQVLLQPLHGFRIEVIGRLVEQQNVRLLDHEATEGHAAFFTAGQHTDLLIGRRAAQRIHGDFEFAFQLPAVRCLDLFLQLRLLVDELFHLIGAGLAHTVADRFVLVQQRHQLLLPFLDDLFDRLVEVELRFLFEQSDAVALRASDLTDVVGIGPGNDFEQRAFSGSVQTQHADLGAVVKAQVDVAQDLLLRRIDLADTDQRKNHLLIVRRHAFPYLMVWYCVEKNTLRGRLQ